MSFVSVIRLFCGAPAGSTCVATHSVVPIPRKTFQLPSGSFWYTTSTVLSLVEGHLTVIDDDPLCQMWHYTLSLTLAALGRDADALVAAERAVAIDPASWLGWREMGIIHATNGRPGEALACAERVMAAAPWSPPNVGLVAGALEAMGHAVVGAWRT